MSVPFRYYLKDRKGNVLAAGQWLGPKNTPEQYDYILVECRACGTKQVTTMLCPLHMRHDWSVKVRRDSNGEPHIDERSEMVPTKVLVRCLACRRMLSVRMVCRFLEPWSGGYGIVKPMSSAWVEVPDEEADES